MSIKSQTSRVAALAVACLIAVSAVALAQLSSSSKGVAPSKIVIGAWAAVDSTIADGTVVMLDTLTAAQGKGVGVRPWDPAALQNRDRVIGVAYGPIPARSTKSPGQVLIYGVHSNVRVASSTLALNIPVRPGAVYGRLSTAVDSTSMAIGWVVGFSSSNSASNARAQVFISGPGRNIGSL